MADSGHVSCYCQYGDEHEDDDTSSLEWPLCALQGEMISFECVRAQFLWHSLIFEYKVIASFFMIAKVLYLNKNIAFLIILKS